jgi:hypothetical protein
VTGTIFIANAHSFKAYTDGRAKETVDRLMSGGDVGHFDEHGLLFIDGRDDDMIVSGGETCRATPPANCCASRWSKWKCPQSYSRSNCGSAAEIRCK